MRLEYKIMMGDILLGELFDQYADQPFFFCDFVPAPAFEMWRALLVSYNHEELRKQGVRFVDGDTGKNATFAFGNNFPYIFHIHDETATYSNM